jgi:hypothetical protein
LIQYRPQNDYAVVYQALFGLKCHVSRRFAGTNNQNGRIRQPAHDSRVGYHQDRRRIDQNRVKLPPDSLQQFR